MSTLYRLKFTDGRSTSPISDEKVRQLIESGKLPENTEVQEVRDGDGINDVWQPLLDHPSFQTSEATFIRKLSDFNIGKKDNSSNDQNRIESQAIPIDEIPIDETGVSSAPGPDKNFPKEFKVDDSLVGSVDEEIEDSSTKVHRYQPDISDSADKTLVRPDTLKYLEQVKKEEESKKKEEELRQEEALKNKPIDYNHEATQILDITELKKDLQTSLNQEVLESERELEEAILEKEAIKKKKELAKKKNTQADQNKKDKEIEEDKRKNKKKLIIYALVLMVMIVLLFPNEDKKETKKIVVLQPKIQFPIEYDKVDRKKSVDLMEKGSLLLEKDSYLYNLKASKVFLKSVEWNLDNKTALEKLFLANALVLDEASNFYKDANTTFKIYKIIPGGTYSSIDKVKGLVYFYKNIGKASAALDVLSKYSKTQKSTTLEIYALWLDLLLDDGQITEAKAKYDLLRAQVDKVDNMATIRPIVFMSLVKYAKIQSEIKTANKWLNIGIKTYPEHIGMLLDKVDLYLRTENIKGMAKYLELVELLGAGNKPGYYAKYLEYTGFLNLLSGKNSEAVKLFKKSLEIKESQNLRTRLSLLKPGYEDKVVNDLIVRSKAIDLYNKAQEAMKTDNWREALKFTTAAVDYSPNYVPVRVLFSKLQMRSGLYDQAISDLKEAIKKNGQSHDLYFALFDVYIHLYKFSETEKLISTLSNSDIVDNPKFPSMLSRMYLKKGDKLAAANWLIQALNKNPLNDKDYYLLAQLYIQSNRFEEARRFLSKAIELEPFEIEYRTAYAKYLYDSKGTDVAIGYLIGLENDERFKKDAAYIKGEKGIYYYRSGKIEGFKAVQGQLALMDFPKKNLYEYVIKTSLIEGEYPRVISNAQKLIEIEPGDIKTYMLLGKIFFEQQRFEKALKEFKIVKLMMNSYPKLKYYIAKAYLSINQVDKAYEIALEEVRDNPHLEDGYVLTGDINVLRGEWTQAEKNYRRALRIKSDSYEAIVGLAYINFKKNKQDNALSLYLKAQRLDPGNSETYRMLGEVYRQLGQGVKAIENYQIYLKRVPNSKYKAGINNYISIMQ